MNRQRHRFQVPPVRVANLFPMRHLGFAGGHRDLGRLDLHLAGPRRLAFGQVLLSSTQRLTRRFQLPPYHQRVPLDQLMEEVKQIGNARALQPRLGQFDERLGPVTDQVQDSGLQRLQSLLDPLIPRLIGAVVRHLFMQHVAADQVHEHQHHALQEGFIYRADNRPDLTLGDALAFPPLGRLYNDELELVHHGPQGTGRTPHMLLKVKASEKRAHRFCSHPALEAKRIENRDHQAD